MYLQPFLYLYALYVSLCRQAYLAFSPQGSPPESMLKELETVNVALDGVTMYGRQFAFTEGFHVILN